MSRLIDVDKLIKRFEVLRDEHETHSISYNALYEILVKEPTAFHTEKVVEEIKKLDLDGVSMVEDGKYTLVRRNEVISLIQTNNACIDELLKEK